MRTAVAVIVLVALCACAEVTFREDAQTAMEDAAVEPSTAAPDAGLAGDDASSEVDAYAEHDADAPPRSDAGLWMAEAALPAALDASGDADAAPLDAGAAVTYAELQPIFWTKCTPCHALDAGILPPFAESYEAVGRASKLCPGERVSACIRRAVKIEIPEGSGCRTVEQPFHREGWRCLTDEERSAILSWQE